MEIQSNVHENNLLRGLESLLPIANNDNVEARVRNIKLT